MVALPRRPVLRSVGLKQLPPATSYLPGFGIHCLILGIPWSELWEASHLLVCSVFWSLNQNTWLDTWSYNGLGPRNTQLVHGAAASASPGSWLEMQNLSPTLELPHQTCTLIRSWGDSLAHFRLRSSVQNSWNRGYCLYVLYVHCLIRPWDRSAIHCPSPG